ncbi:PREDICTED: uncharacterized protein LOC109161852 [Ipomoea nil]|uniref:uncharacterized protein LOC109161852 n=1 Tax=Ipomoea nil TaxID=35883 RepID=UPI000900E4EC|nr:PREDICTED: uncharacterized protein LOC109161852 [Ipomoea nil]
MAAINNGGKGKNSTGGVENSVGVGAGSGSGVFVAPPMRFQNNQKINMEWSAEEQAMLEECLVKFAYDSNIVRYAKIAVQLNNKTVRDVALRCRWMAKKENARKRKEDLNPLRKMKDKKDKLIDPASTTSSNLMVQPGFSPYAQGTATNSNGNSASLNATVQLLQLNSQVFDQISANLSSNQIQDNIVLLCQARDNLFRILSNLNEQQNFVARMPPLPVEVNEELANSILPPSTRLRK